jgi:transaldolase
MKPDSDSPQARIAAGLHGQIAIASAKVAYQIYKEIFGSERFKRLETRRARTQRLLWASTSTKNPAYQDTKYVETLIAPATVDTLPMETLNAYRHHRRPQPGLDRMIPEAYQILEDLSSIGIDLDAVTQQLENEGVEKFIAAFDQLMASLREKGAG